MDGEENKVGVDNAANPNPINDNTIEEAGDITADPITENTNPEPVATSEENSEPKASEEDIKIETGPIISSGKKPEEKPETKSETNSEPEPEAKPEKAPKTPPVTPNFMSTPTGADDVALPNMPAMSEKVTGTKSTGAKKGSPAKVALLCALMLLVGGGIGCGATMLFSSLNDKNSSVQIAAGPAEEKDSNTDNATEPIDELGTINVANIDYKFEPAEDYGNNEYYDEAPGSGVAANMTGTCSNDGKNCEFRISAEDASSYYDLHINNNVLVVKFDAGGAVRQVGIFGFGQAVGDEYIFILMTDGTIKYERVTDAIKNKSVNLKEIKGIQDIVLLSQHGVSVKDDFAGWHTTIAQRLDGRFYDLEKHVK